MLHLIRAEHGAALAPDISEQFIVERQRAVGDRQRMPMPERIGPGYQHLREAVVIMATNIEGPLPLQEIADAIRISRRRTSARPTGRCSGCPPSRERRRVAVNGAAAVATTVA